ncbi:MAG: hypothetical protein ACE5I3_08290 [Phycisphaerae bacterium]
MPSKAAPTTEPIRIDFKSETRVVVTAADEERFVTTSKEAARACKVAENVKDWYDGFDEFLAYVHQWCTERAGTPVRCYVAVSDDGLRILIVTRGKEYNFEFDDEVSELEIQLAHRFPGHPAIGVHTPEGPTDSLGELIDVGGALQVYAE